MQAYRKSWAPDSQISACLVNKNWDKQQQLHILEEMELYILHIFTEHTYQWLYTNNNRQVLDGSEFLNMHDRLRASKTIYYKALTK